jgi:hypothetical protein
MLQADLNFFHHKKKDVKVTQMFPKKQKKKKNQDLGH